MKKIIKESDLIAYIRWSLLKENLTRAEEKALLKAASDGQKAFTKYSKRLIRSYHTDLGTGPKGKAAMDQISNVKSAAEKAFQRNSVPLQSNLKSLIKKWKVDPQVLAKAQAEFTKTTAKEAAKSAASTAASKKTFQAAEKKAAKEAARSAAFQKNIDSAKRDFAKSTPKPSATTPKPSATTPKPSAPTSKPPSKAAQKVAQRLIDRNPAVKKTLTTAAQKALPGATAKAQEVAAKNILALGIQQSEKEVVKQVTKQGVVHASKQIVVRTAVTSLVPVVTTGAVATTGGASLGMLLSLPVSIAGSLGYYAGGKINDYFIGDITDEHYSIKKQAKDKLGMLGKGLFTHNWDMSSDSSYQEKAKEVGFKGIKPRGLDKARRDNVFSVMTTVLLAKDTGASDTQIATSLAEPYVKYRELFDMGYLDEVAWARAARKQKAILLANTVSVTDIEVEPAEGGQAEIDTGPSDIIPDAGNEEILPRPSNVASDWTSYMSKAKGKIDKRDTEQIYQLWRGGDSGTNGVAEKCGKTKSFYSWAKWYTTLYKTGNTGISGVELKVPKKGDLMIGGREWTPGTHLSPTAVRIIMQKIYRGEPMQLTESKLRNLIRRVLIEAVSLPAALSSRSAQIEIQQAMIDKLNISTPAEINAALGVRNGKPDGKIGKKTLATWKQITGKDSFDGVSDIESAKKMISKDKNDKLQRQKAAAAEEEAANQADTQRIEALKKELELIQKKKSAQKMKTLRIVEDLLDYGLEEMMEASTNESSVISGLQKCSNWFRSNNRVVKKMLNQEKGLWEELLTLEPDNGSDYTWGFDSYLPWSPEISYVIAKGNLWSINIFSLVIKNKTGKELNTGTSIIEWYKTALGGLFGGDEVSEMTRVVWESVPEMEDDPYGDPEEYDYI